MMSQDRHRRSSNGSSSNEEGEGAQQPLPTFNPDVIEPDHVIAQLEAAGLVPNLDTDDDEEEQPRHLRQGYREAQRLTSRIELARVRLSAAEEHQAALLEISARTRALNGQLRASAAACQTHSEQARRYAPHHDNDAAA